MLQIASVGDTASTEVDVLLTFDARVRGDQRVHIVGNPVLTGSLAPRCRSLELRCLLNLFVNVTAVAHEIAMLSFGRVITIHLQERGSSQSRC